LLGSLIRALSPTASQHSSTSHPALFPIVFFVKVNPSYEDYKEGREGSEAVGGIKMNMPPSVN
jgi:hypothetical protein